MSTSKYIANSKYQSSREQQHFDGNSNCFAGELLRELTDKVKRHFAISRSLVVNWSSPISLDPEVMGSIATGTASETQKNFRPRKQLDYRSPVIKLTKLITTRAICHYDVT